MIALTPNRTFLLSLALASLLTACASAPRPGDPGTRVFSSTPYGLTVVYPEDIKLAHVFDGGYFIDTSWNPDATDAPGEAVVQLKLPESNQAMTAVMRVGVSDDVNAVDNCRLPQGSNAGPVSTLTLAGVTFRRVDTGDSGMSQSMARHAYRGVAHGNCYAIDLVVSQTREKALPRGVRLPMSTGHAFDRLEYLLKGVSFNG